MTVWMNLGVCAPIGLQAITGGADHRTASHGLRCPSLVAETSVGETHGALRRVTAAGLASNVKLAECNTFLHCASDAELLAPESR